MPLHRELYFYLDAKWLGTEGDEMYGGGAAAPHFTLAKTAVRGRIVGVSESKLASR